jgi:hypothetical protein
MTITPQTTLLIGGSATARTLTDLPAIPVQPHKVRIPWVSPVLGVTSGFRRNSLFSLSFERKLPKIGPMSPMFGTAGNRNQSVHGALLALPNAVWLAACSPGIPDDVAIARLSGSLETVVAR